MADNSWMNHPNLKGIDKRKLEAIMVLAGETGNKKQNELIPFLMTTATRSRKEGLNFTNDEVERIIDVMKIGRSKEELQRMEKVKNMIKLMR